MISTNGAGATTDGTTLLTGASGFLGRHVLWELLSQPGQRVLCLLRDDRREGVAVERLRRLLDAPEAALSDEAKRRCTLIVGDLADDKLGLSSDQYDGLTAEISDIVHCAATVRFNLPLDEARNVNVRGTQKILDLGAAIQRRGRLRRIDYFSTAYVAGDASGRFGEDELRPVGFHNTYDRTKWEAEQLVRQHQTELPIAILRPSIIVGDSRSGYTSNFRVLYWPLKVLASGYVIVVPADRDGLVDVVPIDYVVAAFQALRARPESVGGCFHLTAGPSRQSSCGELLEMACEFFRVRRPVMIPTSLSYNLVRPLLYTVFWGKRRELLRTGEVYFPYFAYRASFDTRAAQAHLQAAGISPPPVEDYFRNIMRYCVESDWGRATGGSGSSASVRR